MCKRFLLTEIRFYGPAYRLSWINGIRVKVPEARPLPALSRQL